MILLILYLAFCILLVHKREYVVSVLYNCLYYITHYLYPTIKSTNKPTNKNINQTTNQLLTKNKFRE